MIVSIVHFPMFGSMRHAFIPVTAQTYNVPIYNNYKIDSVFMDISDDNGSLNYDEQSIKLHTKISFAAFSIGHGAFWS